MFFWFPSQLVHYWHTENTDFFVCGFFSFRLIFWKHLPDPSVSRFPLNAGSYLPKRKLWLILFQVVSLSFSCFIAVTHPSPLLPSPPLPPPSLLHSGEMAPPPSQASGSWTRWFGYRRAGSTLCPRWAVPVDQTDQLSYHPDHSLGLGLAHLNTYPSYDLLECLEGLVLLSYLQDLRPPPSRTAGYLVGVALRVQYWWWARGHRPWTRQMTP